MFLTIRTNTKKKKKRSGPRFLAHTFEEKQRINKHQRVVQKVADKVITQRMRDNIFKVKLLTPQQRQAIHLLTNFSRPLSDGQICSRLGITHKRLAKWLNDELFCAELNVEITKNKGIGRLYAWRHVIVKIMRGEYRVIRDYLRSSGDFKEHVEVTEKSNYDNVPTHELETEVQKLERELGLQIVKDKSAKSINDSSSAKKTLPTSRIKATQGA